MRIVSFRTLNGPNVFHDRPVVLMKLDLEDKAETTSVDVPGFIDRLCGILPGLHEHQCSLRRPGGFVERLHRGTYFGHIIEHIALELSTMAGIEVSFGKTTYAGNPGVYNVVTRFMNEAAMKHLLAKSVEFVEALIAGKEYDLNPVVEEAKEIAADTALGPSSRAIVEAAEKRGIPWRRLGEHSLIQLGYGANSRRVQTAVTDRTGLIATELVQDKDLTKKILRDAMVPVPDGTIARNEKELFEAMSELRAPYVVKPFDGHHGDGVSLNLVTPEEVLNAYELAREHSSAVLIEEMCRGRDYRVLVIGGKLTAVAERIPAHVIGDGRSTIQELIDRTNLDPRRGEGHGNVLTKIEVDDVLLAFIEKAGRSLDSVPRDGERVLLRKNANLSTGGIAIDVTDHVHPAVRALCERVARISGLDVCGIDLIHSDIRQPPGEGTGVIEVNAGPGLRMHMAPSEGKARPVGERIIEMMYPEGSTARIPIAAVTGTNGKTTTARLLARIFGQAGYRVGSTSSDGIMIGEDTIATGDTTGPQSAWTVLSDTAVEAAVLEVARGGLLRGGLAYDWSDVGVITNIRPDHIGQDGIEDIEDLVRIKSLVAERVREGGTLVLNADDAETSRILEIPRVSRRARNVVFFSLRDDNPIVRSHVARGGRALICRRGWILEVSGNVEVPLMKTVEIPMTLGGRAPFQIANVLAAAAAAIGYGLNRETIKTAMANFKLGADNRGRLNLYKVGQGYVILDYAHNPDALEAFNAMLEGWDGYKKTAIVGLPGDRQDEQIFESARIVCRGFDRLVLRDDLDLRGRAPGEVPEMMMKAIRTERTEVDVTVVLDELEAFKMSLDQLEPNEVLAVFFDKIEPVLAVLRDYDPIPLEGFPVVDDTGAGDLVEMVRKQDRGASAEDIAAALV